MLNVRDFLLKRFLSYREDKRLVKLFWPALFLFSVGIILPLKLLAYREQAEHSAGVDEKDVFAAN